MTWVALLYSIVLAPAYGWVVMSELRDMAEGLGCAAPARWSPPATWCSRAPGTQARALESRLEPAFEARFGRHIDIIVRSAERWRRLIAGNPFKEAAFTLAWTH